MPETQVKTATENIAEAVALPRPLLPRPMYRYLKRNTLSVARKSVERITMAKAERPESAVPRTAPRL
jgi:hypothetical protein